LWIVAFWVERAFHSTLTAISSVLFKLRQNIALDVGLAGESFHEEVELLLQRASKLRILSKTKVGLITQIEAELIL
jgi:hypothetical protein